MPFTVGENVGPYRIIEQLGQGGMATVFKAYHASLDRYVAIKALHPAFNQDPNFEARFRREARVVAKLEHTHIVPVYDYAEHEKRPYLVMKFIEGMTLKARMDQGSLTSEEITRIVDAVGSALAYAHKQGVLHRDIKPSNVLLAAEGQIYLADFGLARMAQSGESTLSSDMIMGTPQYISPEQAMGKADLDQRTDLYSFGVMLYEMVVGKVPFNADTPFSIIHDHIYSPLPLPRTVNPKVPEAVERVLLKSLAKERTDRFEDAGLLVTAFKSAWQEAGVPIQGSDLRASEVLRAETKVANPPETVAPTKMSPVHGEEGPKVPEPVPVGRKTRSPWVWVGMGLVVLVCVGGLAFARNNRIFARFLTRQADVPTEVSVVSAPVEQPNEQGFKADEHLSLALQAWQEGDLKRSMDEVTQLVALHGDRTEYLAEAGAQLFGARQFIGAAYVYVRAAQVYRDRGEQIPIEVRDQFEASFYFAAEMDGLPLYLPLEALRANEPALVFFAEARYAILHGNMEVARRNLEELLKIQPEWPLAKLLNAEVMFAEGSLLEPRKILLDLSQTPRTPQWIRDQAETLLKKYQ